MSTRVDLCISRFVISTNSSFFFLLFFPNEKQYYFVTVSKRDSAGRCSVPRFFQVRALIARLFFSLFSFFFFFNHVQTRYRYRTLNRRFNDCPERTIFIIPLQYSDVSRLSDSRQWLTAFRKIAFI